MSKREMEICYTCGAAICGDNVEEHHFPLPKKAGGLHTVIMCRTCHDLVDRINLGDWPADWVLEGWQALPLQGKLMAMKLIGRLHPCDLPPASSQAHRIQSA